MNRRGFLQATAASAAFAKDAPRLPDYRIVTPFAPSASPGMPGPWPGQAVSVRSEKSIDAATDTPNAAVVREMLAKGMTMLTGESSQSGAWRRLVTASDIVGIKVNCSGKPRVVSSPELVAEIVRNLMGIGLKAEQIYLYERFQDHLNIVNYAPHLPAGIRAIGAEASRGSNRNYDPSVYVETSFFGEDDTRSNLIRLVSRTFTKIINVGVLKDHGAAGVTGCLKNLAYGSFSNVARSHQRDASHTYSFIGTLANVEPLRSRTVLQVLDGLRGVWHLGPFDANPRFRFYPKLIAVGTDPVVIDRIVLDVIEAKRKEEGAISVWDRSPATLRNQQRRSEDPNINQFIREPGHIEYAAKLGLGIYDSSKVRIREIRL